MITKKLDFQVGQVWFNKLDQLIRVLQVSGASMEADDGFSYCCDGTCPGHPERDLIEPKAAPITTNLGLPEVATADPVTVGDINSSAKGSGARYNAGKPPFDLVPLGLMAEYYSVLEAGAGSYFDPILALSALGEFQAGGDGEDLLNVLGNLGDGWEECANVFGYGQKKYAAWNWSKGMAWSVPIACAARHLRALIGGEELDPESGLSHRGHVYCNVAMLYTFIETYAEGDDRAPAGSLTLELDDADGALHFDQSK